MASSASSHSNQSSPRMHVRFENHVEFEGVWLEASVQAPVSNTPNAKPPTEDRNNVQLRRAQQIQEVKTVEEAPGLGHGVDAHVAPSDSLDAHNSDLMPKAQNIEDADSDPDMPIRCREGADKARSQPLTEHYVPWLGSKITETILLRIYGLALLLSSFPLVLYCSILLVGLNSDVDSTLSEIWSIWMPRMRPLIYFSSGVTCWAPFVMLFISPRYIRQVAWRVAGQIACIAFLSGAFGFYTWEFFKFSFYSGTLGGWFTEGWLHSFRGCSSRVSPQQAALFGMRINETQVSRILYGIGDPWFQDGLKFNMSLFHSIQTDPILCGKGFVGNKDLYGLGIRTGVYLQWISSLLANNTLPENSQELQKVYLIFSFAICIATIVISFTGTCTFGVEFEVLHWMYWGGSICVFASSPCTIRLGSEVKWTRLDWITVVLFTTHLMMVYHAIWYIWYPFDQKVAQMPCGTYHFFFAPMLDPSEVFWAFRVMMSTVLVPLAFPLLLGLPLIAILLVSEIKHTVQNSATYQMFLPTRDDPNSQDFRHSQPGRFTSPRLALRIYRSIRERYQSLREEVGLPSHGRGGIRLVTPLDIKDRRNYRIQCAGVGLVSCVLAIVAIEMTLKWNRVCGVFSIASPDQYVALTVGASSFVSICWRLVQQEGIRRRDLRQRRQQLSASMDGTELDTLPSATLADAIHHAFTQPDVGFLTSGGALPTNSIEAAQQERESEDTFRRSDSPGLSPVSQSSGGGFFMSGALPPQPGAAA